jgi:hypothetical protein
MLSKRNSKPGPSEDADLSKPTSPGSSQLAQRQPMPQTPFDQILAMLDDSARAQLLHALQVYKVDPNDGYMVILLSHATIAQSLLDAPDRIKGGIDTILRSIAIFRRSKRRPSRRWKRRSPRVWLGRVRATLRLRRCLGWPH